MSTQAEASTRLDHIDGMRACAALIVYANHAYAQVTAGDAVQLSGPLSSFRSFMIAGHLSVTVFIILSGFCLTLPIVQHGGQLRGGVRGFLARRARRILPPYYAAVVLCLILIWTVIGKPTGTLWDFPIRVTPLAIVAHLLLLQDLFATALINYVFWSIAIEWQIYLVVPVLNRAWNRFGAIWVLIATLLIGYTARIAFAETRIARTHPQFLAMFAFGMLAAHVARSHDIRFSRWRQRIPWAMIGGLGFIVSATLSWYWGVSKSENRFYILDLPVAVMTTGILVASSMAEPSALTRLFAWKPLVAVGTFSYSLYLIHAPLLQVLWQYALSPWNLSRESMLVWLMSAGLGAVLLVAYLFFRLFEAPFMGAVHRPRRLPGAVASPV